VFWGVSVKLWVLLSECVLMSSFPCLPFLSFYNTTTTTLPLAPCPSVLHTHTHPPPPPFFFSPPPPPPPGRTTTPAGITLTWLPCGWTSTSCQQPSQPSVRPRRQQQQPAPAAATRPQQQTSKTALDETLWLQVMLGAASEAWAAP